MSLLHRLIHQSSCSHNLRAIPCLSNSRSSAIRPSLYQNHSTIAHSATPEVHQDQSGCLYKVDKVLKEVPFPPHLVSLASCEEQKVILKYIHPANFEDLEDINRKLRGASHVRLPRDTIPDKSMFVFDYFTGHLLRLTQEDLPLSVTKRILKDALMGLAELHGQDIVHTDIKADNVFVNWKRNGDEILIDKVQLGDLEDAAHMPPGSAMIGKQAGNWMWRSPEAHARGPVNKPSDIFSCALVCIYAIHKRVIFAVGDDELKPGLERLALVIERQMPYFADNDSVDGFLAHLGDNPWAEVFQVTRDGFDKEHPRTPFALWDNVDEDFRSLICAMACFDPAKRITASEALAHRWFDV
ncbi:kinase-like protein [Aspergillus californicus]